MTEKLENLLEKRKKLNAQIQKEKNKHLARTRKENTRKKILLGALMLEMIEQEEIKKSEILKKLDKFLTRDADRKLFDLL